MAVLVRTNRQAQEVKRHLAEAGVPAVIYNAGSVFHQPEALDLRRLLRAVADPSGEDRLRTVLATSLVRAPGEGAGVRGRGAGLVVRPGGSLFSATGTYGTGMGSSACFGNWPYGKIIAARLLAGPGGERYLTNVLHLSELLHRASLERGLGIGELIQWLDARRMQANDTADAHQMRLESDDRAVTIMTVHKSKGLEFPGRFLPLRLGGAAAAAAPVSLPSGRPLRTSPAGLGLRSLGEQPGQDGGGTVGRGNPSTVCRRHPVPRNPAISFGGRCPRANTPPWPICSIAKAIRIQGRIGRGYSRKSPPLSRRRTTMPTAHLSKLWFGSPKAP